MLKPRKTLAWWQPDRVPWQPQQFNQLIRVEPGSEFNWKHWCWTWRPI